MHDTVAEVPAQFGDYEFIAMKIKKSFVAIAALLVLAVGGGLIWFYSSLDSLVQAAIEKYGSEITQVPVRVSRVTLAPTDGKGAIQGLSVGNPGGFKTESALKTGEISLKIDAASITKDVIVINEVVIQSPEVIYESGDSGNNLEIIRKNVESYVAKMSAGKESSPGKKLIIDNLYVRDGKANVNTPLTIGKTVTLPIPTLHLRDIGKKSNGASAGEVTKQVWDALTHSVGGAVSRMGGTIKEGARGLVESAGKLFK